MVVAKSYPRSAAGCQTNATGPAIRDRLELGEPRELPLQMGGYNLPQRTISDDQIRARGAVTAMGQFPGAFFEALSPAES